MRDAGVNGGQDVRNSTEPHPACSDQGTDLLRTTSRSDAKAHARPCSHLPRRPRAVTPCPDHREAPPLLWRSSVACKELAPRCSLSKESRGLPDAVLSLAVTWLLPLVCVALTRAGDSAQVRGQPHPKGRKSRGKRLPPSPVVSTAARMDLSLVAGAGLRGGHSAPLPRRGFPSFWRH